MSTMAQTPASSISTITHDDIRLYAQSNVNLKRDDVSEYREQVGRLRDHLQRFADSHPNYGLVKTLLSGSLAKGTALKTLNDIDVAFYVKADKAPSFEPELLDWIAKRLREAYPQMSPDQIQVNRHSVCIKYAVSGLNVDVVPVLYKGDPDWRGYLFGFAGSEPVLTSIPMHLAFVRKRKDQQPDNFAQIIRLTKWWIRQQKNVNSQFRLKSFMAELIVAHLSDNGLKMMDYPAALERVFAYIVQTGLKKRISFSDFYQSDALPEKTGRPIEIFDPVCPTNNVAADYDDANRQVIVKAAQTALDSISWARFAPSRGKAIEAWQEVLGSTFRG